MENKMSFTKGKLLARLGKTSLLMVGVVSFSVSANAQDSDNEADARKNADIEEVIVTGIRASERAAVDIKRLGSGVLDAIAAEDIGELPSPSIAESLMTLPGVSGNQDNGRSNTISVRGLGGNYTRSTLNGREIVSSFNTRSVNFSLYPGEVIRRGIVYKTATPELIEGGVGGTVDLHTIRPLGLKDNIRNVNAYGLYNNSASNSAFSNGFGQNVSGMISHKFADNFAVAVGGVYLVEEQRSERLNIGDIGYAGWHLDYDDDPDTREFSAGGGGLQNHSREVRRDSIFATAQWRATDRLEFIADYLVSNYNYDTDMATIYFWGLNSNNDEYAAYRDEAIIGEGGQVMRGYAPAVNFNISPTQVINRDKTDVFGLNMAYRGDTWTTSLDLSYSGAKRSYAWMSTNAEYGDVPLMWDFTDIENPSLDMDEGVDLTDISQYGPIEKVSNPKNHSETELSAVRLDFSRDFETNSNRDLVSMLGISGVKFGVRFSEQTKWQREDQEVYDDDAVTGLNLADLVEPFANDGAFSSFDNAMPQDWLYFSPTSVLNASGHANDERVWDAADQFASFNLKEETSAVYLMFDMDNELLGRPLYGNLGVRYFDTDVESTGVKGEYSLKYLAWADDYKLIVDQSTLHDEVAENSYGDWLPSLNLNWAVSDEFIIRLGAGRSILLPRIGEMDNATNLKTGRIFSAESKEKQRTIGTRGNPYLEPIISDQVDLSFEFYPGNGDIFSIALFTKQMDGIYEKNADYIDVEGLDLPMPIVTTVKTDRDGKIKGVEFNFRKELDFLPGPFEHLTLSGNHTIMDIDTWQDYNANEAFKEDFAWIAYTEINYLAEGMSETTSSAALSYDDNNKWSGRVGWHGQDYAAGRDGSTYMLRRPTDFWSGALNYRINDQFRVVAQVWNMLDAKTTNGQLASKNAGQPYPDYIRRTQSDGRSWRIGLRMNFD